jgi:hypothetical protein
MLLGNDSEAKDTTAVARLRPANYNSEMATVGGNFFIEILGNPELYYN